MADEDDKAYRWETEYEKTWEVLQEDESGSLQASVDDIIHRNKRRKLLQRTQANVQLGMMRHLYLVLDMSAAMEDQDLKPTRLLSMLKLLEHFVEEYFDQNPVSQMGIIATRNKRAEKMSELAGNPRRHIQKLQELKSKACQGEPSLQNSLEMALQTLRHVPGHASREILIIFGSLTTCDPGDIGDTLQALQSSSVRVSTVGLAAEVRVCRRISQETRGRYDVILDETHFKDLLNAHVAPPPAAGTSESSLIKMGFPHQQLGAGHEEKPAMCMCHLDSKTESGFSTTGYFCPQCQAKYCELPVECKACGLTLVSAPHLARSYHHLFPLAAYEEVNVRTALSSAKQFCYACQKRFTETQGYRCGKCRQVFCIDCDLFIHDTLHSCPGCASNRHTQQQHL